MAPSCEQTFDGSFSSPNKFYGLSNERAIIIEGTMSNILIQDFEDFAKDLRSSTSLLSRL